MGLFPKNRDDRVWVSNAASLLYTLLETKTPVEISLILGWGEEFRHARAFRRAKRGGYVRFRFLDLCIRFGKMISKVCEGFNSGANEDNTNSFFEV